MDTRNRNDRGNFLQDVRRNNRLDEMHIARPAVPSGPISHPSLGVGPMAVSDPSVLLTNYIDLENELIRGGGKRAVDYVHGAPRTSVQVSTSHLGYSQMFPKHHSWKPDNHGGKIGVKLNTAGPDARPYMRL